MPGSSRIAQTGILFHSALSDRNAASHVAFGHSQAACLASGGPSSQRPEDVGANQSVVHIDCMFGSEAMSVDGVLGSGVVEPVMRGGQFVI